MRLRTSTFLAIVFLCLATTATHADLTPFSDDFEGLEATNPEAFYDTGWLVFGNVFGPPPDYWYWYGYGAFPAPNLTAGFSSVAVGEGGPAQGDQQVVIYSDYNNGNHFDGSGAFIEANFFQEQLITAADIGTTWRFEFDAKLGDIGGQTTASAFFKTIQTVPCCSANVFPIDMTYIPATWNTYAIDLTIDPSFEGQLLQFGFASFTTAAQFSGMFYDNVRFDLAPLSVGFDVKPGSCPNPINSRARGVLPTALLGSEDFDVSLVDVDSLRLNGVAPLFWSNEDTGSPYDGQTCGCAANGPDGFLDLTMHFANRDIIDSINPSERGEYEVVLTGRLLDGTEIEGQDCVLVVGGGGAGDPRFSSESQANRRRDKMRTFRNMGPVVPSPTDR